MISRNINLYSNGFKGSSGSKENDILLNKPLSSNSTLVKKNEIRTILSGTESKKGSLTDRLEEKRYHLNGFSVSSQPKMKVNIPNQPLISPTKDSKQFSKLSALGTGSKSLTDRVLAQTRQSSQPPKGMTENIFRERRDSPQKSGSLIRQTPSLQKTAAFPSNPTTTPLGQSRLDSAQWNTDYNLPKSSGPQLPLALQQSKQSGSVSTELLTRLGKGSQNPPYQKKRSGDIILNSDVKIFSTFGGALAEQSSPKTKDKKIKIPNEVDKVLSNQQYVSLVKPSHEKVSSQLSESHERTVQSRASKAEIVPAGVSADREKLSALIETNSLLELLASELERYRQSGKRLSKEEYIKLKSSIMLGELPTTQPTDPSAEFLRLRLETLEATCASLTMTLHELQTAS